ncbi:hypothetical protein I203_102796 [Kwoniella mangroviensis CBS 8507]|uniref:uncharacterized protein n=1 Tax=Kwoniella mangroviensis CBS 8507 TaxID=1296122 RepID=UPI00306627A8
MRFLAELCKQPRTCNVYPNGDYKIPLSAKAFELAPLRIGHGGGHPVDYPDRYHKTRHRRRGEQQRPFRSGSSDIGRNDLYTNLSPCCLTGGRLTGTPRGTWEPAIQGERKVARYHTTPSKSGGDENGTARVVDGKLALVLLTDAFGLSLPNAKIMADAFAEQLKDQRARSRIYHRPSSCGSIVEVLWKTWRWLPMLLFPKKQVPLAQSAINDLTSEGYTSIAVVGSSRGGAMVQHLLSNPVNTTLVGGVICHPSPEKETWTKIIKPTYWHLADHDQMFGQKDINKLRETFEKKKDEQGVDFQCKVHKDTVHGFAARPTLDHENTKFAFEESNSSAVEFCRKYLLGKD